MDLEGSILNIYIVWYFSKPLITLSLYSCNLQEYREELSKFLNFYFMSGNELTLIENTLILS